jgi:hypothetical protein
MYFNSGQDKKSLKLFNPDENLFIVDGSAKPLAIWERSSAMSDEQVYLGMDGLSRTDYILKIKDNTQTNQSLYLVDLLTGDVQLIQKSEPLLYPFTTNGEAHLEKRFMITTQKTYVDEVNESVYSLYPNPSYAGDNLRIEGLQADDIVKIYSLEGRLINDGMSDSNGIIKWDEPTDTLATGIYLLKINSDGEITTIKLVRN